jgi:hypothetical protein
MHVKKSDLTQMELHQVLAYDPETGVFTWIEPAARAVQPGQEAGFIKKGVASGGGYRFIKVNSVAYAAHRLAWLYMTGEWPPHEIDHVNRNRSDNRFANLRAVTHKQNMENLNLSKANTSGFRGVSWAAGKWSAIITHFGERKVLGTFDDIEQAKAARLAAERELFTHSTPSETV